MLNKAERFTVLQLYGICCDIGQLPAQVDLKNWRLKAPPKSRRFVSFLSISSFILHTVYKIGSLAYAFFLDPNVQLHHLVIHAVLAMGVTMALIWYSKVYMSDFALHAQCFNVTLMGNVGDLPDEEDLLGKHWTDRLRDYSLQDLVALGVPLMGGLPIPFVITAFIYDPTNPYLLYNALPVQLQTWILFGLCLLEEARLLVMVVVTIFPVWQLQVITYDLVVRKLQLLISAIQNGKRGARGVYRVLRILQLYVSMLNNVNSYLVFTGKLTAISVATLSGYAAVAHFREHPILGVMYYATLIDSTLVYTVIYDKAFKIPQWFEEASACALLHTVGKQRHLLRRQVLSIPRAGIKVGNFHFMERISTLIFVDFVVRNIVGLLVAYG